MKTNTFLFFFLSCFLISAAKSEEAAGTELQMAVSNPEKFSGTLYLALHRLDEKNSTQNWEQLKSFIRIKRPSWSQLNGNVTLPSVPPGLYAIRLFVDENQNGQLDTTPGGIPLEPVGFSTNPTLLFGMPTPKETSFYIANEPVKISIKLVKRSNKKEQAPVQEPKL